MNPTHAVGSLVVIPLLVSAGCTSRPASGSAPEAAASRTAPTSGAEASEELSPRLIRRFKPLTRVPEPTGALVDLGRMLYYDGRISYSGDVSCNTCHPLDRYGTTSEPVSTGVGGRKGSRNAPSVYHAAGHFRQFWDGRSPDVEDQAKGPISNPVEMAMTPDDVVQRLAAIDGYQPLFAAAFPGGSSPITFDHAAVAIGAFERGLITPSRWDRYLEGDHAALSSLEKSGVKEFANLGCMVCHTGENIGGSMFEKVGVREPWPNQTDAGRKHVTGDDGDDMVFKVPSLRNVARTGPYFHDGSVATLDEAVRMMARYQVGEQLEPGEVKAIVAWLGALTGEIPQAYIARPRLPGEVGGP